MHVGGGVEFDTWTKGRREAYKAVGDWISKLDAQRGNAMTESPPAYTLIPLPGEGPEDVVVGPGGVIYTGLA